jgi:hypothetical protein
MSKDAPKEIIANAKGLGWLVFSGKKHNEHKEADELVAIVYDGMYEALAGSEHAVENDPE